MHLTVMGTMHTDTEDSVFVYRVAQIEEMGFSNEEALQLACATKLISRKEGGRTYLHEWPISWHDVAKLIEAGATHDQVLRILL